ncbi:hypothetical protein WDW89_02550 [Deltaproteobacteria bacterium TL4]
MHDSNTQDDSIIFIKISWFLCYAMWIIMVMAFLSLSQRTWAFDNDRTINLIDFKRENFLDLKAYQFRKEMEDLWYESDSGWRGSGGSLGVDLLYVSMEMKWRRKLSEWVTVELKLWQNEFYAIKPMRQLVEIEFHFWEPLAFFAMGTPAYDKRDADLGGGFIIGDSRWHYLKFSQLNQDVFYNEKNFYDDSYYIQEPRETRLEGAFRLPNRVQGRFSWRRDHPLSMKFPEQNTSFTHEGQEGKIILDCFLSAQRLFGFSYQGFDFKKARLTPNTDEGANNSKQEMSYHSADIYWLDQLTSKSHLTVGIQYDRIQNTLRNLSNEHQSLDYYYQTLQLYLLLLRAYTENASWEFGLYNGDSKELQDFITNVKKDTEGHSLESKLRISWEYRYTRSDYLLLTTSWNMDDLLGNFWDGGHLSYQTTF